MTFSRILLGIVAFAVGLRLTLGLLMPMDLASDSAAYLAMATSAAEGNGLVDTFGNRAYYSPGYPMLLALVFLVTGPKLGAVLAVNLALAAASVFLVHRVARSAAQWATGPDSAPANNRQPATGNHLPQPPACNLPSAPAGSFTSGAEWSGLLAAAAWSVYIPSIVLVNIVHKENLMIPLMLALVWAALGWPAARRRVALAAAAGAAAGVLALVGATGCAVAGALAAVVAVYGHDRRQRLAAAGAFLLAALAVILPWMGRNYAVLGAPVLFTNAGFNMYLGNNPAATGRYISIADTPMRGEWNRIHSEQGELAADREAARRARRHMGQHPGRTLALFLKKAVIFWEPPYLTSVDPEPLEKRVARYVWFVQYLLLMALALAGLKDLRRTWPLYLAIGLFAAIHIPFVVMLRYRLPIMALVAAASAPIGAGSWKLGARSSKIGVRSSKLGVRRRR